MKTILTSILACATFLAFSQKYRAPFGEMPEAEILEALRMKSYEPSPQAAALMLYSRSEAEIADVGSIEMVKLGTKVKRLRRIKIFNKNTDEIDGLVNEVLFARKLGYFTLRGFSYNLVDGKVVKTPLEESGIFKTRHNKDLDEVSFTMPKIENGTVIEYEFSETKSLSLPWWFLQYPVPSLYSEVFFTNTEISFRAVVGGPLPIQYETLKGKKVHHWYVANVPAFTDEPQMPNEDLFRSNVQIWTYEKDSWEAQMRALWNSRYFGGVILDQPFVRERAQELSANITDPKEKIKAILSFIKSKVEWNEEEDFLAEDSDKVLREKKGTSGDINLMLISMLAKVGITVNPILLSSRDNGHSHEDIPSLMQFNYVICQAIVGRDTLYIDATQRGLQYDCLPQKCVNVRALNAARDGYKWFTLRPSYKEKVSVEANLVLGQQGELQGKLSFIHDGYAASDARSEYYAKGHNYKSDLKDSWLVDGKKYQNEMATDLPFHEQYDLKIPDQTTVTGDIIYINPYIVPFEEKNPFLADSRQFPVEFYAPSEKTLLCNITIPEGYKIEELPQSKLMALPGNAARATFNVTSAGTQIQVMARVQINRTLYYHEEYAMLKDFYSRIFSKQGEQIVLKRVP